MKTYKIEPALAVKLRKQLLWSNIVGFIAGLMLVFAAAADIGGAIAIFVITAIVATIISIWAYWRALWNLWEWPGIGIGVGVGFCVFVLNAATGFLGFFASIAFLAYMYVQLGKQTGEVVLTKREEFKE